MNQAYTIPNTTIPLGKLVILVPMYYYWFFQGDAILRTTLTEIQHLMHAKAGTQRTVSLLKANVK